MDELAFLEASMALDAADKHTCKSWRLPYVQIAWLELLPDDRQVLLQFDFARLHIGNEVPRPDLLPHAGHLGHNDIARWLSENLLQLVEFLLVLDTPVVQLNIKLFPKVVVLYLRHLAVVPQVSNEKSECVCVSVDKNGAIFACSQRVSA